MNTRLQNIFVLCASLLLMLCVGACYRSPTGQAGSASTQVDHAQEVENRFVVLSPAIGVMLRDLGFEDSIVGRHSYDAALSQAIPVVGSHLDIDYEMLLELSPTDLFFEKNMTGVPQRLRMLADEHDWDIWEYELKTLDDIAVTVDDLYLKLVGFSDNASSEDGLFNTQVDPTVKFDVDLPSARLAQAWSPMGRVSAGAGRVLVLAGIEPPGAMGPGSFHGQLIERLGCSAAIVDGGMWQELDHEDLIELAPDSILVFAPKAQSEHDLIGEPEPMSWSQIKEQMGAISTLGLPAFEHRRVAIIEHPLGLLPSSSFGQVAQEVRAVLERWVDEGADGP